jgi:hypothetical protein
VHTVFWLENQKGRGRHRMKNNIRMNLREIRWECVGWLHLAQDRDKWQALAKTK